MKDLRKINEGWVVVETAKTHKQLIADLKKAVKKNNMNVVTQAGPTNAAKNRGVEIPKNNVVGVFNNKFAVRILELSTEAMIEAPMRFYVTENNNGTATLAYKKPEFILEPYFNDQSNKLRGNR